MPFSSYWWEIEELIRRALAEDLGPGDATTNACVKRGIKAEGRIVARQDLVLAGQMVAAMVFGILDQEVEYEISKPDGERAVKGEAVARLSGPAGSLLTGERLALNFLTHLSGIATYTARFVAAVGDKKTRIVDTRKTIPGLRRLEKYAVRMGGGHNHRQGLFDGVLIKDNHIALAGGIKNAVGNARRSSGYLLKIEVETESLAEVREALDAGADVIMLDNLDLTTMQKAMELIAGRVPVEVSGGVSLEKIPALAALNVDFISVGALTHSAPAADLSLDLKLV